MTMAVLSVLGLVIKSPQDLSVSVLVGRSFPSRRWSQVGRGEETKSGVGKGLWASHTLAPLMSGAGELGWLLPVSYRWLLV